MSRLMAASAILLLAVPAWAQQKPAAPLMIAFGGPPGVVWPRFEFVNQEWQEVAQDSSGVPSHWLPDRWYQLRSTGTPVPLEGGNTVRVLFDEDPETEPYWLLGQLVSPAASEGSVLLDSLLPSGTFVQDTSRATRARLSPVLKRLFPDSFAVPDPTGVSKELRRGSAPVGRVTVQRAVPARSPALMVVEAERCTVKEAARDDCGETQLFDLWLLDDGKRFQVLGQRGPVMSDTDFKSGGSLSGQAWLEVESRRFVVMQCQGYTGSGTYIVEIRPNGVRPTRIHEGHC